MKRKISVGLFLMLCQISFAQYGVLDQTFNGSGQTGTLFEGDSKAGSVTFQSNGKIIIAGNSDVATTFGDKFVGFVRLNENGSFDNTFGINGTIRMRVKNASFTVFAGLTPVNENTFYLLSQYGNFSLTKLNTDCIVDNTFGTNGTIDFIYGSSAFAISKIIPEPNGKFMAYGSAKQTTTSPYGVAIAKYNANGTVDTTHGTNGFIFLPLDNIPGTNYFGMPLLMEDGKYLVVGTYVFTDVNNVQKRNFFLKKFNANGTVDTTYGTNGTTFSAEIASAFQYKLEADNSLSVWGNPTTTYIGGTPSSIKKVQFDANGNYIDLPAINFNTGLPNTYIFNVILQDDGKVVYAGRYMDATPTNGTNSFVCRALPNGTPDATFGNNGTFSASFTSGNENISRIAVAPDGKLVFAGTRIYNGHWEYLMGRLTSGIVLGKLDFLSEKSGLLVYPNPVQSNTTLAYELTEDQNVRIAIYDLTGKLTRELVRDTKRAKGKHTETLNLQGYPSGSYIIKVSNGSNQYHTKIIVE